MKRNAAMNSGSSLSLWADTELMPQFSRLSGNEEADVCIIGGGIAGLTTAYLLSQEGVSVVLLESAELCSGQTGRTTAHFVTALDDRFFEIERLHGSTGAKIAAESHADAIDRVAAIIRKEGIECDLAHLDGYLFAAGDYRPDLLERELAAARRAGLKGIELIQKSPLSFFDIGPSLRFPRQMQLHPLKYLSGLARSIEAASGRIYTHSHVVNVEGGDLAEVKTKNGQKIRCGAVVVATNTPVNDRFVLHTKQAPYRTYVLGFQVPNGSVPKILLWDTLDPYHYVRMGQASGNDILIVGGEDHKTGQESEPNSCFERLEYWARARFPMAGASVYQWSGQVMEPVDGMGFIGHNPLDRDNVYVITGDSGNGMTHGTIGGILVSDQIMGRKKGWEDLYNPARKSFLSTPEFIKENANVAAQYVDWVEGKTKPDLDDLEAGEGVVFRKGLKMIAAYKAENGRMDFHSAACPHLGGVVRWNSVEKTWDCPCHGSRFDGHGKVIEGPAISDLSKESMEEPSKELEDRGKRTA